jgi:hypothetical protein
MQLLAARCLQSCFTPGIRGLRWASLLRPPHPAIAAPPRRAARPLHASAGSGQSGGEDDTRDKAAARIEAILSRAAPTTAGGAPAAPAAAHRPRARQRTPPP